jgi:hypothetical protein
MSNNFRSIYLIMERPKPTIEIPIERVNIFLKKHTFIITEMSGLPIKNLNIKFKIEITNVESYISVGDWKDFVEYSLIILPTDDKTENILKLVFPTLKYNNYPEALESVWYRITNKTNEHLSEFLKYFGYNIRTTCKKIINKLVNDVSESIIFESKMDSVTRKIVSDIITFVKTQKDGEFELPGDISDDMVYSFPQLDTQFSVDLSLKESSDVETFVADAEFSKDDDTIFISIIFNPEVGNNILYNLAGELNELVAHELTHIKQHERGYEFPKEPKKPKKYYSQEHELEAQLAGFKRKAKIQGKPLEDVMIDWFEKNKFKHNLKPKQVKSIISKILELG